MLPHLVDAMPAGRAALVFGPERTGLTNEEVSRCTYLVHIPTDPATPALNLAQAVAICLYELKLAVQASSTAAAVFQRAAAPAADQERMFTLLRDSLERIEYLSEPKGDALMYGLRHLIGRALPTPMEVGLLTGLARQIQWFADHCQGGP
jgi:tRNA/rRNA methyltransferase